MHRSRRKHSMNALGGALVVVITVAGGAAGESCFLGTKTNFCERWGLICKPGQECAANQPVCIDIGGCGDGVVNPGEVCDDGNIEDGDGCSADCQSDETCGNGIRDSHVTIPEECDDGRLNGTFNDHCGFDCRLKTGPS
jgi:cysteine-rich repeat protein